MLDFFLKLFESKSFMPHGHCFLWNPGVLWLHVVSDAIVALAYFSIPPVLWMFMRRRKDIPFPWVLGLFATFILACGTTHVLSIYTFWVPVYRLDGLIKLFTALISIGTALALLPILPKLLAMKSPSELERINRELREEITKRSELESALRESEAIRRSEEQFRILAEAIEPIIWTARPDGFIEYFNESWYELTGFTRGAGGMDWDAIIHPDDSEAVRGIWSNALKSGLPFVVEFRFWDRKVQDFRWYLGRGRSTKDADGKVVRWIGTCTDIHAQKNAGELMAREQAALEASRLKSEFLANMSHEIRTPINGVIGMSGLLLATPLNDEQKEFAGAIRRSADILLTVINDILDFSKIEAGKLQFDEIDFSVKDLVDQTLKNFEYQAKEKGLYLKADFESDPALILRGDPVRLKQVLTNLLGNALKFTQQGGISIRVKTLTDAVRFEVEDSGIGIPASAKSRMFLAFSQLDPSTNRKFGGTGLGLSISRKLIELMSGEIGVESEVGKGSLFWFTVRLPRGASVLAQAPRASSDHSASTVFPRRKGRVLVAEDNVINQKIAVKMLEKMGLQADVAANGLEAVQAVKNAFYDLILMDCQMPEMDGYEATRRIREEGASLNPGIPILALTANAIKGDAERCLAVGMNDYIAKPIAPALLADVIDRWLAREGKSRSTFSDPSNAE